MPKIKDRIKAFMEGKTVIEWNGNKPGKWVWHDIGGMEIDGDYLLTKPEVKRTIERVRKLRGK